MEKNYRAFIEMYNLVLCNYHPEPPMVRTRILDASFSSRMTLFRRNRIFLSASWSKINGRDGLFAFIPTLD